MKCLPSSPKDDNHSTPPGLGRGKPPRHPGLVRERRHGLALPNPAAGWGTGAAAVPSVILAVIPSVILAAISPVVLAVALAVGFSAAGGLAAPSVFAAETEGELLQRLKNGGVEQRRQALARLGRLGGEGTVPALVEALRDFDQVNRALAEQALWSIWMRSGDARVDALLRNGTRLMAEGELEKAVDAFDRVIRLRPGFAEGYNKRATVMYQLGRFQQSLADIAETLRRNPYHFGALSGAGLCLVGLKRPREAIDFFQRALRINPNMKGIAALKKRLEGQVRGRMT